jgi:hypothetical protein
MTRMRKKVLIRLADKIRNANKHIDGCFSRQAIERLAEFCLEVNPRFKRERWLGYIKGLNGPNGGYVGPRKHTCKPKPLKVFD